MIESLRVLKETQLTVKPVPVSGKGQKRRRAQFRHPALPYN
jgi:hypothetical protein